MNKKMEEKLTAEFEKQFKKIHTEGLTQGSKAMCAVILAKATDESKTYEERITEIVRFCTISVGDTNHEV